MTGLPETDINSINLINQWNSKDISTRIFRIERNGDDKKTRGSKNRPDSLSSANGQRGKLGKTLSTKQESHEYS